MLTAAAVRSRLLESERRRIALAGQVESLSEANGLLTLVNSVARTLPTSLTLREALHTAQRQIADTFDARVVCLLTLDENAEEWVPKLAEGCVLRPAYRTEMLPEPLADGAPARRARCCAATWTASRRRTGSPTRAGAASTCGSRPATSRSACWASSIPSSPTSTNATSGCWSDWPRCWP